MFLHLVLYVRMVRSLTAVGYHPMSVIHRILIQGQEICGMQGCY